MNNLDISGTMVHILYNNFILYYVTLYDNVYRNIYFHFVQVWTNLILLFWNYASLYWIILKQSIYFFWGVQSYSYNNERNLTIANRNRQSVSIWTYPRDLSFSWSSNSVLICLIYCSGSPGKLLKYQKQTHGYYKTTGETKYEVSKNYD